MDKWNERLFDNLSRLVANERKSKAASTPVERIPIAVSYGMTGYVTGSRSKAASSSRVGYHEDGSIAWTKKTRLRTTPAENLRAMMFVE